MMNLDVNSDARKQRVYAIMYLKRMFSLRQMDLDYSLSQMIQICISPTKVYKMTAWRKQTKNQWARDDPSFIIISLVFVAAIAIAYTLALRPLTLIYYLKSFVQSILFTLLFGIAIASILWYFVNHYMRIQRPHSPEQFVEWLYSVDIHFNSMIPVILIGGVIQYLFLPFLVKNSWLSTLFSGLLVIACIVCYSFVSFLGYMYLPFIKTPYFLFAVGGILCCVVLIMMVCGVNFTQLWISHYFFPDLM